MIWDKCVDIEMGAPVQDGLACEGASCVENWWRVEGPIGGFLYDVNEWRGICR
jgi:hypothetical protein